MLYLVFLFFKHYLVDFVWQTDAEVRSKAIYCDALGMRHSAEHGLLTYFLSLLITQNVGVALLLGAIDFILHYHIDWAKMNFGCRDITNPLFWNHLGLDQLAHGLTYIGMARYVATLG